ncbi:MAG: hypothetical protein AAF708_21050 [Deinococcota bacterium]
MLDALISVAVLLDVMARVVASSVESYIVILQLIVTVMTLVPDVFLLAREANFARQQPSKTSTFIG